MQRVHNVRLLVLLLLLFLLLLLLLLQCAKLWCILINMQIVQAVPLVPMNRYFQFSFFYAAYTAYAQRLIKLCIDILQHQRHHYAYIVNFLIELFACNCTECKSCKNCFTCRGQIPPTPAVNPSQLFRLLFIIPNRNLMRVQSSVRGVKDSKSVTMRFITADCKRSKWKIIMENSFFISKYHSVFVWNQHCLWGTSIWVLLSV